MTGAEIMAVVGFIVMLFVAVSGVWWKIARQMKEGDDASAARAESAAALASLVQSNLDAHRLHTAETYVSKAGHRESTEQVMDAIHAVKSAIDGTNQRIDRMWESQSGQQRATRVRGA